MQLLLPKLIPVQAEKEKAFEIITEGYLKKGNLSEAVAYAAKAGVAGPRFESKILKSIVEKHCENKDTDKATAIAAMIADPTEKAAATNNTR